MSSKMGVREQQVCRKNQGSEQLGLEMHSTP